MGKLQEICNEKNLSTIGDLASKIGNNIFTDTYFASFFIIEKDKHFSTI